MMSRFYIVNTTTTRQFVNSGYFYLAVIYTLFSSNLFAESISITNGEWPPYQSQKLKHYGFVSLIVSEAFALEGVDVEYRFRPWKRAFQEAKSGDANASMIWSYTPERNKNFDFSDVIITSDAVLFHHTKLKFNWSKYSDLEKYKIGGTLGYRYSIEDLPSIKIERVPTDIQNLNKLLKRRIDLWPSDMHAGYALINKELSPAEGETITHNTNPYDRTPYSVIFSKKRQENKKLIQKFNQGLKALKVSGRYEQILASQKRAEFVVE